MPFFVHAYAQLCLVLNNLVFQKSSRVLGGRFSSMYIGVVVCFVFYDFFNGEVIIGSLFEGDFVFSFVEAYDDVWWCFFHVVVF